MIGWQERLQQSEISGSGIDCGAVRKEGVLFCVCRGGDSTIRWVGFFRFLCVCVMSGLWPVEAGAYL